MSSTFLYLAIVAVWAVVLVPMWLRRDTRLQHRRPVAEDVFLDELAVADEADEADDEVVATAMPAPPVPDLEWTAPRRRPSRATVIARRRRRTFLLSVFLLAALGLVLAGLAPWWTALPPVVLLTAHLALLRVAAGVDAARREARARAHAHARRLAEAAHQPEEPATPTAEIIKLVVPDVFDQYADDRRAVGD